MDNIVAMAEAKSEMFKRIYFIKTDSKMEIAFAENKERCTHAKVDAMIIHRPLQAHFHAGGEVFINNIHGIGESLGLLEVMLDSSLWDDLLKKLTRMDDELLREGMHDMYCEGYCWLFVDFDSREDLIGFISGKRLYWKEQMEAMKERMIARPKEKYKLGDGIGQETENIV